MAQVMSSSGQYSLQYFLPLLLYPSSTCISILALDDRMHKADFSNTDFPLPLIVLRGKLPHREQCVHLIFFQVQCYHCCLWGNLWTDHHFHPFHLSAIREVIFLKRVGCSQFCLLKLLLWLSFWSSHYCKTCINASYRAISA